MIEIPEAKVISKQLDSALRDKQIVKAAAGSHPHKFAWYSGEPTEYGEKLEGRTVKSACSHAARIFLELDDGKALVFGEGTNISLYDAKDKIPPKHQLIIHFDDNMVLVVSIRMYGFILLESIEEINNKYIKDSMVIPSPPDDDFTLEYFMDLFRKNSDSNLSAKAFLATEQRIPGLGNGVLQDILLNAHIHPKKKLKDFDDEQPDNLYNSIVITIGEMADQGGRDTEKDIYGNSGEYKSMLSKKTVGNPCPFCGSLIEKQSYMGGSIYFCPECQELG